MSNMVELIKTAAIQAIDDSMPMNVLFGIVVSTSPLQISVEQKMTLNETYLVLTSLVSNFLMPISTDSGNVTMNVQLGLRQGESVILLRAQGGQKYIVLDRVR